MTPEKFATVRRVIENDRESCLKQLDTYATSMIENMNFLRRRIADAQQNGSHYIGHHNSSTLDYAASMQRLITKLESVESRAKELAWLTDETKGATP